MNGRERFLTALHGGMPDRVPLFETHFCLRFIREILGDEASPYHNVDDEVNVARPPVSTWSGPRRWASPPLPTSSSTASATRTSGAPGTATGREFLAGFVDGEHGGQ